MIEINLIRHGKTAGNLRRRYIGVTDEPLCPEGVEELKKREYPQAQTWVVSPMRRCRETAALICRKEAAEYRIVSDFRECDFGMFENKNYMELSDCPEYQRWAASGGTLPFPDGEDPKQFRRRSCGAFERMLERIEMEGWQSVNMVVHGGTIMSIMERYALPKRDYYQWQVENGGGYRLSVDWEDWKSAGRLINYERMRV